MPRKARPFLDERLRPKGLDPHLVKHLLRRSRSASQDPGPAIAAIAHAEGWLKPLPPIARVTLRPWQRAVFWGLRVYIAIMLIVMGWGFVHAAGG
jgi:hypothetical protein